MKKIIGLVIGCLLGGCATQPESNSSQTPRAALGRLGLGTQNTRSLEGTSLRDAAPLPWVRVYPSERALELKQMDFNFIARHIRHSMAFYTDKFKNVNLVLVDYAILPAENPKKEFMKKKYKGQIYCKKYITKPERYFMRISFYEEEQRPLAPLDRPLFVGTAVFAVVHAPLFEAMRYLADDIVTEYVRSPAKKIEVNLSVGEAILGESEIPTGKKPSINADEENHP